MPMERSKHMEKGESIMREYIVPIYDGSPDHDEIFVGYIRENATEVVRCKDCKHRWPDLDEGKMICLLERSRRADDDEWFCADGKRRNE